MTGTWGERFDEALKDAKLTKSGVARALGVGYRTVLRWTKDEDRPDEDRHGAIAELGPAFRTLVKELTQEAQRGAAGGVEKKVATLNAAHRKLEATVRRLSQAVDALELRIAELERRRTRTVPRTAQGGQST